MKSIIVACTDEEAYRQIEATFQSGCTVERTPEKSGALELLQTITLAGNLFTLTLLQKLPGNKVSEPAVLK